jgi:hypothetical protein
MTYEIGAPLGALDRFDYRGASVPYTLENGVLVAFARGVYGAEMVYPVCADFGQLIRDLGVRATVAFLDRCGWEVSGAELEAATMIQVRWGRLVQPCALVGSPKSLPALHDYARRMARHGVIREVFSTAQSFQALDWARARAETARRQAIYLQRTSHRCTNEPEPASRDWSFLQTIPGLQSP